RDFHGWQVQPNVPTVQGLLAAACARIIGESVKVVGASRTDAGVHALRQVASVTTHSSIEAAQLQRGLNALLPSAIRGVESREAPVRFDARRSAPGERYVYVIDRAPFADPFWRRYAWHVPFVLDPAPMRQALRTVRGKHDFSAFCAAAGRDRTPLCTVRSVRLAVNKGRLAMFISADSF